MSKLSDLWVQVVGLVGPSGRTCVSKLLDLWVQIVAFLIGLVSPCLDGLVGPVVLMPNFVLVVCPQRLLDWGVHTLKTDLWVWVDLCVLNLDLWVHSISGLWAIRI